MNAPAAVSRRSFLSGCTAAMAAARLAADPLGMPIGCQVFPVREALGKDFEGTLRQIAAMGYRSIEMCSPPGYERSGFGPLVKYTAAEMRRVIKSAGLRCDSCHYVFRELKEKLDERIAYARELGLKQMILSSFGIRAGAPAADWARAAEELNKIGERTRKAGLQLGFHNHNAEFEKAGGVLIYDELMRRFDARLVKMQFQVASISVGVEAVPWLTKFPGRFVSLHLADWSATEKKLVPVGSGVVDWKKLFAAAKKAGVKNYYVEMNIDAMRASVAFLRGLKV